VSLFDPVQRDPELLTIVQKEHNHRLPLVILFQTLNITFQTISPVTGEILTLHKDRVSFETLPVPVPDQRPLHSGRRHLQNIVFRYPFMVIEPGLQRSTHRRALVYGHTAFTRQGVPGIHSNPQNGSPWTANPTGLDHLESHKLQPGLHFAVEIWMGIGLGLLSFPVRPELRG
jgi:hypothetical protein